MAEQVKGENTDKDHLNETNTGPSEFDESLSSLPTCLLFATNKFYNPVDNTTYQQKNSFENMQNVAVQASNHGWFLMTRRWTEIFFYNPVTRVRINLPDLPDQRQGHYRNSLDFTSPPTSTDCQVIGFSSVYNDEREENLGICTIKRNETSWTFRKCPVGDMFRFSACKPTLFQGMYYWLGEYGNVIKYNPDNNTCSCNDDGDNEMDMDVVGKAIDYSYVHRYMVESDGELLAVFVARTGLWVQTYRLDVDNLVLVEMADLGDRVLYLSNAGSFSEPAEIGNKIYLPKFHGSDLLFYSPGTKKFQSDADACYSSENLLDAKYYGDSVWIKPAFDPICAQEFKW